MTHDRNYQVIRVRDERRGEEVRELGKVRAPTYEDAIDRAGAQFGRHNVKMGRIVVVG